MVEETLRLGEQAVPMRFQAISPLFSQDHVCLMDIPLLELGKAVALLSQVLPRLRGDSRSGNYFFLNILLNSRSI